jgi:ribonuclease-3
MRFGIVKATTEAKEIPEVKKPGSQPLGRDQYHRIESALAYQFKSHEWLERALTHRSVHAKGDKNDYERLEFLGDAVFDLAVAHLLLDHHPEAREGELSKMRAALVNTASLAELARRVELGPFIRLSRGELASGGGDRSSILADVLEAVIGAVYRESGYDVALRCVAGLFGDLLKSVTPRDPKTELQEALHASGSEAPVYLLECVEGPEHAPSFISVVEVDGQIVGRGRGATKKASQQAAAAEALDRLKVGDEIDQPFLASRELSDPSFADGSGGGSGDTNGDGSGESSEAEE